jgi:CRISPR-associated protein Csd1
MIIKRLHDLAERENLLADPAFELLPVPYVIELGDDGMLLGEGISERRETLVIPAKKKGGVPKQKRGPGRTIAVPRPHGSPASQGFARFFTDTVSRVIPMTYDLATAKAAQRTAEVAKRERSRATFWSQIGKAADETGDPALRAVQSFGRRLVDEPEFAARFERTLAERGAAANDRCTFAYGPDNGRTLIDRGSVRSWYRSHYNAYTGSKQEAGPTGICQVTGKVGPIPTAHPIKFQIPGWTSMPVALVSYDKTAFESFGLKGTANAAVGYTSADAYGAALNALVQKQPPWGGRSNLRVGDSLFLFWTREPADTDFMESFEAPTAERIAKLLRTAEAGSPNGLSGDVNDFYCLALSNNAARVIVRAYLEETIPKARTNLAAWFRDLRIASTRELGQPVATFPLWTLAASMAAPKAGNQTDWTRVNELVPRLLESALKDSPLPDSVLATCLQRIRVEGSTGFRPQRMALMKLSLLRREIFMSECLDPMQQNPAYVCGELLALFEQIQRAALGKLKANVVDKYYGGFSAAPLTALGTLFQNAQNHLRSLRSENPRHAAGLDKRLALTVNRLKDVPEGQLSLADQARFALGYYHAKAARIEHWAETQRKRAEAQVRSRAANAKASPGAHA